MLKTKYHSYSHILSVPRIIVVAPKPPSQASKWDEMLLIASGVISNKNEMFGLNPVLFQLIYLSKTPIHIDSNCRLCCKCPSSDGLQCLFLALADSVPKHGDIMVDRKSMLEMPEKDE